MMRAVLFWLLCAGMVQAQPLDVQMHPTLIGLFGASDGAFLRADGATNGGVWTPYSALQGSLFLPAGASGNTLRYTGSGWAAATNITNTGHFVGIYAPSPQVLLDIRHPGNDAFVSIVGYDSKLTVGGTMGGDYARSAQFALESENGGIRERITYIVPSNRSTALYEIYGGEITNPFTGTSGIVRTQESNPFYQKIWNAGGMIEYGYINKANGQVFSEPDFVWLYQYRKNGSFYNKVSAENLNDIGIHYMTQPNKDGLGAVTRYYTNSDITPDFMGATGLLFRGGVSDGHKQFVVHVADINSPKMVVTGHVPARCGIGVPSPLTELHVDGTIRATSLGGGTARILQCSTNGDIQATSILQSDMITTSTTAGGDLSGTYPNPTVAKMQGRTILSTAPTTGQVLKWDGSAWAPAADAGGTTYTAGTGISLAGNVITNTAPDQTVTVTGATGTYPNFTLPDQSATNEIQNLSLTGQALGISGGSGVTLPVVGVVGSGMGIGTSVASGVVFVTNTGDADATNDITTSTTAGGDLSGTYPNPTVARMQGRAVSANAPTTGQILKWNGTTWVPDTDSNSGGTVTSVAVAAGTGISVSGSPVTGSGTITVTNTGDTNAGDDITSLFAGSGISVSGTGNSRNIINTGVLSTTSAGGDVSGTFSNLQIVANAVGTTEIATGAITTTKVATGAITSTQLADLGTLNADIGFQAISTDKIQPNAITPDKLENTGVAAGVYGDENELLRIEVDADGRLLDITERPRTSVTVNTPGTYFIQQSDIFLHVDPTTGSITIDPVYIDVHMPCDVVVCCNASQSVIVTAQNVNLKIPGQYGTQNTDYTCGAGEHFTLIKRPMGYVEIKK